MKQLLFIFWLLFAYTATFAQSPILDGFNIWLEKKSLKPYLKASRIDTEIQDGTRYTRLWLTLETTTDTAIVWWRQTSEQLKNSKNYGLTELLFWEYAYLARTTQPDTLVILVNDRDRNFWIAIYFNSDSNKVDWQSSIPLSQERSFTLPAVNAGITGVKIKVKPTDRNELYQQISGFVSNMYKQKHGLNGHAIVSDMQITDLGYLPGDEKLKIRVSSLKNEVLYGSQNPMVCWLLDLFYDQSSCLPWEYLEFTFFYNSAQNKLSISIDGRFSDGTYKPIHWDKAKPMEPDFTGYLSDYADDFKKKLYFYLSNQ